MSGIHIELHYEGDHDGVCDVLIEHGTDTILVTVTERDDNPGMPITHCIDGIATQIAVTMPSASMPKVRFAEHYPKDREAPYDEVTFIWAEDRVARLPQWRSLSVDGYKRLRAELGILTG